MVTALLLPNLWILATTLWVDLFPGLLPIMTEMDV